jgi:hypothetical protein
MKFDIRECNVKIVERFEVFFIEDRNGGHFAEGSIARVRASAASNR